MSLSAERICRQPCRWPWSNQNQPWTFPQQNHICSRNVTFSLLFPSGIDLTWHMTCNPHQNCLFSVLHFPFRVTVWSHLYTGVSKGRGQKGNAGRMEERKVTPACGQQHRLQPTAEQSDLSLAGGDSSCGRRGKLVLLNFTLITGCQERSWGSLALSVWNTRNRSRMLVSPAMGMCCISNPKNRTMAQQTLKMLQLKQGRM